MKPDHIKYDDEPGTSVLRLMRGDAERVMSQDENGYFTDEYFDGERYELEHEKELDFDGNLYVPGEEEE